MKFIDKIKELGRINMHINKVQRNTYDTLASLLLHRLFPDSTVLPFSPFSLNPNTILHIINDLQVNRRNSVIEFGTGVSTLIMAKFIKSNGLTTQILSVDHDLKWSAYIEEELIKHNCSEQVTLLVAPLCEHNNDQYSGKWYNEIIVKNAMDQKTFDMLLVDGPSAGEHKHVRFSALPIIFEALEDNFIIFLDDIRRPGERKILEEWEGMFHNAKKDVIVNYDVNKVYAVIKSPGGFSTNPMSY